MRVPKSTIPWVTAYRERYRTDEAFREAEKARVRARYTPATNEFILEDGREFIGSKKFCQIAGISKSLLYALIRDKIIPYERTNRSKRYLFLEADAHLFRDFLPRYLKNKGFVTFERYDIHRLTKFLHDYSGLYDYENRILKEKIPENTVTQLEKM